MEAQDQVVRHRSNPRPGPADGGLRVHSPNPASLTPQRGPVGDLPVAFRKILPLAAVLSANLRWLPPVRTGHCPLHRQYPSTSRTLRTLRSTSWSTLTWPNWSSTDSCSILENFRSWLGWLPYRTLNSTTRPTIISARFLLVSFPRWLWCPSSLPRRRTLTRSDRAEHFLDLMGNKHDAGAPMAFKVRRTSEQVLHLLRRQYRGGFVENQNLCSAIQGP
jgi:hypothetical protein